MNYNTLSLKLTFYLLLMFGSSIVSAFEPKRIIGFWSLLPSSPNVANIIEIDDKKQATFYTVTCSAETQSFQIDHQEKLDFDIDSNNIISFYEKNHSLEKTFQILALTPYEMKLTHFPNEPIHLEEVYIRKEHLEPICIDSMP